MELLIEYQGIVPLLSFDGHCFTVGEAVSIMRIDIDGDTEPYENFGRLHEIHHEYIVLRSVASDNYHFIIGRDEIVSISR